MRARNKRKVFIGALAVVAYSSGAHAVKLPSIPSVASAITRAAPAAPTGSSAQLTSGQNAFGNRLAADTGLNTGVVRAWLLAEESGGAAAGRQSAGNNDWLNVGYTDTTTYGAGDAVWNDPVQAADTTAAWMRGQQPVAGYGLSSGSIRSIARTARAPAATQIAAIRNSGWASSGYPSLSSLYQQLTG